MPSLHEFLSLENLSKEVINLLGYPCPACGEEAYIPSFAQDQVIYACASCGHTDTFVTEVKEEALGSIPEDYITAYEYFYSNIFQKVRGELGDDTRRFFNATPVIQFFRSLRNKVSQLIEAGQLDSPEAMTIRLENNSIEYILSKLIPAFQKALEDGKEFTTQYLKSFS